LTLGPRVASLAQAAARPVRSSRQRDPFWGERGLAAGCHPLESYPQHTQWADPPSGILDAGGVGRIVADSDPEYLPTQGILDLRLARTFKLGGQRQVQLILDGFNVFNTNIATNIDYQFEYGKVTGIVGSRRFRGSIRYEF
jgi:hypothetical protein